MYNNTAALLQIFHAPKWNEHVLVGLACYPAKAVAREKAPEIQ
jgi:hypothetical protein